MTLATPTTKTCRWGPRVLRHGWGTRGCGGFLGWWRLRLRNWLGIAVVGVLSMAAMGGPRLLAQAAPPAPATKPDDNPFPGDPAKAPTAQAQPAAPGAAQSKPGAQPAKPGEDNPFPGENTNAPVLSIDEIEGKVPKTADTARKTPVPADSGVRRPIDPDGDPVRTPDLGMTASAGAGDSDDGFSSSRSGMTHVPAEDDNDSAPGKSEKVKTREQVIKEDLDIGSFYADKKNWKAAQARYGAAFALDAENPDAVFGLAEAEQHLSLWKDAETHYKLFLSYDPDGPHSRQARKGLEQAESAGSSAATVPPK